MSSSFLDCFYSYILLPNVATRTSLDREVISAADRIYDQRQGELSELFGGSLPPRKSWRKRVRKMVTHPELFDDGMAVSVRANGSVQKPSHAAIVEWLAIELLRQAPAGHKTPFMVVTNALGQAPGSSGWVTLNARGDGLVPVFL